MLRPEGKQHDENDEDKERRRQRRLEEIEEVKSLRRIISAYLNYPEAAEEDVRRYERSYLRIPPQHKALLSHYPLKFNRMRRCIAVNSYLIFNMLQGFEPPLDMSLDIDEEPYVGNAQHQHCSEMSVFSCPCAPTSKREVAQDCEDGGKGVEIKDVQEAHNETENCGERDIVSSNGEASSSSPQWLDPSIETSVPLVDVDKVRCIIRNIVRDWAEEGQQEREQCYNPILDELDVLFPNREKESPPSCLVPGAGLGRLALEISRLGFASQGNEFSYYMMICSSFILNCAQTAGEWKIYPWIHSNCNSLSDSDQFRPVSIPDIHPASAGITQGFSMCGGDFVEVYSDPNQIGAWDAVVTCFFIDTAHNIVEYIEIISKILKDGGIWINFGPLLYHFADMYGHEDDISIELSLEDVKRVALHYGFQFEKEKTIETTYTTNPRSMMQNRYFAAFWTMRKTSTDNKSPEQ